MNEREGKRFTATVLKKFKEGITEEKWAGGKSLEKVAKKTFANITRAGKKGSQGEGRIGDRAVAPTSSVKQPGTPETTGGKGQLKKKRPKPGNSPFFWG